MNTERVSDETARQLEVDKIVTQCVNNLNGLLELNKKVYAKTSLDALNDRDVQAGVYNYFSHKGYSVRFAEDLEEDALWVDLRKHDGGLETTAKTPKANAMGAHG